MMGTLPASFYRRWSAEAATIALTTSESRMHDRCVHSANIWSLIADAIDSGDSAQLASLTMNLTYLVDDRILAI
ncbi:MAG: hypothetical protein DI623_05665 [Sphingomonas sanxanigenens]|uniref:Uncharacterized protein n=1 Tax=Sphingomonas sanxanigenens TaxID=397260 RepID=A0A2W5A7Y6_9SPHN|nr:MAG: hypothetical protein DI623_05665 [Sphingomonas sanxanigenens]